MEAALDTAPSKPTARKIGGWLILIAISVTLTPFVLLFAVFQLYQELFTAGGWAFLTTPGSPYYHAMWSSVLIAELVIPAGLALAGFWLMSLFFAKSRRFPKAYIWVHLFAIGFLILDAAALKVMLPEIPMFDEQTTKELSRSAIQFFIIATYLFVSERAKETFVL